MSRSRKKKTPLRPRPASPWPPFGDPLFAEAAEAYGRNDLAGARTACAALLAKAPNHAGALNLISCVELAAGDLAAADLALLKALAVSPTDGNLHANRCGVLNCLGRFQEAATVGRTACGLVPEDANAAINLGNALLGGKRTAEAAEVFVRAHDLRPTDLNPLKQVLLCARMLGDFAAAARWNAKLAELFASGVNPQVEGVEDYLNLAYLDVVQPLPPGVVSRLTSVADQILTGRALTAPLPRVPRPRSDGPRLRLGYLSGMLGDHPVGHVVHGLFAAHDRDRFEIHGFSLGNRSRETEPFHAHIRRSCEHFHDLAGRPARDVALSVRRQGIDVLIFLDGLMLPAGLEILAYRPAPLQLFWLGHAGGLGMSFVDGLFADHVVLPPERAFLYRERVVWLPRIYHCASPQPEARRLPSREECGLPGSGTVFCGFNNPEKIDAPTFEMWMEVLRQVPDSVLWLSNQRGESVLESNLRGEAEARGVAGGRLIFAQRIPDKAAHLARHVHADLLLDTLPLNASTTALDALWAGAPILTVPGDRFGSRIAASMASALEVPEMACGSPEDLAARAVRLARDPASLAALKAKVRAKRKTAALFDLGRFVRELESAVLELAASGRGLSWRDEIGMAAP